jgi:hypothetical protein
VFFYLHTNTVLARQIAVEPPNTWWRMVDASHPNAMAPWWLVELAVPWSQGWLLVTMVASIVRVKEWFGEPISVRYFTETILHHAIFAILSLAIQWDDSRGFWFHGAIITITEVSSVPLALADVAYGGLSHAPRSVQAVFAVAFFLFRLLLYHCVVWAPPRRCNRLRLGKDGHGPLQVRCSLLGFFPGTRLHEPALGRTDLQENTGLVLNKMHPKGRVFLVGVDMRGEGGGINATHGHPPWPPCRG